MKNETVIGSVSGPCGLYDSIHYKGTALDGHNYFRFHFYINRKHHSDVTSTILESCYQVEEQFLKYARTLEQPIGKEKKMKTTDTKKAENFTVSLKENIKRKGWFQVIVNGGVIALFEKKEQAENYAKPLIKLGNPSLKTEIIQSINRL
jgi:hypothetical protein